MEGASVIDLHTHILPGVDDGVKSEDEAVAFARVAWEDGVRTIVATPHCKEGFYFNDRRAVLEALAQLRPRIARELPGMTLLPGAEVHLSPDLVERVRDGRAPTLADNGRTLLLELSLTQYPVGLEELVFQLRVGGILTVFAHPERVRYFLDDPQRYAAVLRLGAYGQITTGSILGQFGEEIQEFSEELVRKRWVHVLASDAHNVRGRPPRLGSALARVASWIGEAEARRLVTDYPAALLRGEALEEEEPQPQPRRASVWTRWFGRRGER